MNGGQINVTYGLDPADWSALVLKLNELAGNKTRTYIARALNKTATSARVKLGNRAQASYTVKSGGFKKDMQIERANAGNLVATIKSHGDTLNVPRFKWSHPKSGVKIDVVRSGLKPMGKYGNTAFYGKGKLNGQVFVRKGKDRHPIEKLKSKSVPYMIGSENRVYGPLKSEIQSDLNKYMNQQIKLLLG